MNKEQLRMQMLAGIITESQYKQKLDEGLKDITVGVIMALGTLLGGEAKAQVIDIASDYKPTKIELKQADDLLKNLEKKASSKKIDTLFNIQPEDSIYQNFAGENKELTKSELIKLQQTIETTYFNKAGKVIGKKSQTKGEYDSGEKFGTDQYIRSTRDKDQFNDSFEQSYDTRLGADSTYFKGISNKDTYKINYNPETGKSTYGGAWGDYVKKLIQKKDE